MYVCHMHVVSVKARREGDGFPGIGLQTVVSCMWCWAPNLGPLEKQPVLLIAKPSPLSLEDTFRDQFSPSSMGPKD